MSKDFIRETPDIKLRDETTTSVPAKAPTKEARQRRPPVKTTKKEAVRSVASEQSTKPETVSTAPVEQAPGIRTDRFTPTEEIPGIDFSHSMPLAWEYRAKVIRSVAPEAPVIQAEPYSPAPTVITSQKNDGIRIITANTDIPLRQIRDIPTVALRTEYESPEASSPEVQAAATTEQSAAFVVQSAARTPSKESRRKHIIEVHQEQVKKRQEQKSPPPAPPKEADDPPDIPAPRTREDCVTPIQTRQNSSQIVYRTPETKSVGVTRDETLSHKPDTPKASQRTIQQERRRSARKEHIRTNQRSLLQSRRKTAENTEKTVTAVKKTGKAILDASTGTAGLIALLLIFCIVLLAGAIAASPLGILFTAESGEITLSEAIAEISAEYSAELRSHQSGTYTTIRQTGHKPSWLEVVAVFACKTSMSDDGADVMTLDARRVAQLGSVFWDMTEISTSVQSVFHADSDPEDEIDDSWTETILTVNTSAKTADDMRQEYRFNRQQNEALDLLLVELKELGLFLSDLDIEDPGALVLWNNLPGSLSEERRQVVYYALTLVGKVNYFWGGKSLVLGWDSRWGTSTLVTAAGSPTTGTYRPYGMDCSGYVDWVFYNVTSGSYVIGQGGGCISQHNNCYSISWSDAQPGDLVFYSGDSHIGIVGGWDEYGNIQIIHCASGSLNGVFITGISGFTSIGRPYYYS